MYQIEIPDKPKTLSVRLSPAEIIDLNDYLSDLQKDKTIVLGSSRDMFLEMLKRLKNNVSTDLRIENLIEENKRLQAENLIEENERLQAENEMLKTRVETSVETGVETSVETSVETGIETSVETSVETGIETGEDVEDTRVNTFVNNDVNTDVNNDVNTDVNNDVNTDVLKQKFIEIRESIFENEELSDVEILETMAEIITSNTNTPAIEIPIEVEKKLTPNQVLLNLKEKQRAILEYIARWRSVKKLDPEILSLEEVIKRMVFNMSTLTDYGEMFETGISERKFKKEIR